MIFGKNVVNFSLQCIAQVEPDVSESIFIFDVVENKTYNVNIEKYYSN